MYYYYYNYYYNNNYYNTIQLQRACELQSEKSRPSLT